MDTKLNISFGTPDDVVTAVTHLVELHSGLLHRIVGSAQRDKRSVAFFNLAKRCGFELEQLRLWLLVGQTAATETLAWHTRNLFELNLIVRYVLKSSKNLDLWEGQTAKDEIDFLRGILGVVSDKESSDAKVIAERIAHVQSLVERHGVQVPTSKEKLGYLDMASSLGLEDEYRALYRLFSKYVHPSSWLVNTSDENAQCWQYRQIFIIRAQMYAWDTYTRLCHALGIEPRS